LKSALRQSIISVPIVMLKCDISYIHLREKSRKKKRKTQAGNRIACAGAVSNCSLIGNQISQWWRKQVTQSSRYVGRKQTDRAHEIARCRRTEHEIWISLILQRPSNIENFSTCSSREYRSRSSSFSIVLARACPYRSH